MTITAAADGSALGNPGPAGWAWYIDDGRWAAGGWPRATNNVGELRAVLELFRATAHLDDDLLVLCDSRYVIDSLTKWLPGWKRKGWRKADGSPVLNVELMKDLDAALQGRRYRFEWVKGHVGHALNEAADERARAAATAYQTSSAVPGGPGLGSLPDGTALGASSAAPAPPATAPEPRTSEALLDLDAPPTSGHRLTVDLSTAEWRAVQQRAKRAGQSPEVWARTALLGG